MTPADEEEPEPMAMKGLFDLRTFEHLLHKLEWEYARWQEEPLNTYMAWNFFVTAEQLPDWLAQRDHQPNDFPYKFKRKRPLLRICSHLANGGKHFRPGNHHSSVASTRAQGGWVPLGWVPEGWVELPALMVDLTSDEQKALSSPSASVDALSLGAQVLAFWQPYFSGTSGP
jgi:hypothetical protein